MVSLTIEPPSPRSPDQAEGEDAGDDSNDTEPSGEGRPAILGIRLQEENPARHLGSILAGQVAGRGGGIEVASIEKGGLRQDLAHGAVLRPRWSCEELVTTDPPCRKIVEELDEVVACRAVDQGEDGAAVLSKMVAHRGLMPGTAFPSSALRRTGCAFAHVDVHCCHRMCDHATGRALHCVRCAGCSGTI